MIAYFQGGSLDGHVLPEISKHAKSVGNPLPDGRKEWYRQSGKKVTVSAKQTKEKATARVYRFDCIVDPPKPKQKRQRMQPVSFGLVPSEPAPTPSGTVPAPSGCEVTGSGSVISPLVNLQCDQA